MIQPVARVGRLGGCRDTFGAHPFDVRTMQGAKLADLSLIRFEEQYWPDIDALGLLKANERDVEQRLAACRMAMSADDPIPTVLASSRWHASRHLSYVQFLRCQRGDLSDPAIDG